jgi:N-acetylglutamate synthase-like GNAT family acetyltransferase
VIVRRFSPDDADRLSRLIIRNLELVNIHDYSGEVINALIRTYSPEIISHMAKNTYTIVCVDGENIVGTALLEGDQVRNVFVDVEMHGKGIGRLLMTEIEARALENQLPRLWLHSGITGEGFYYKLGYKSIATVELDLNGVPLSVIEMEKELAQI